MKTPSNQRWQTILPAAIATVFCLSVISCNQAPPDMFPKSVGAFQLKEDSKPWTDEKGHRNFDGKYMSPDNKVVGCHGFDASSEEEAVMAVYENGTRDDAHPPKPILDKTGKQIGVELLTVRPSSTSSLSWNIGKRAYWCNTEVTEKTIEEFFNNWQSQTSK